MWDMKRRSAWVTLVVIIAVQCSVMAYWATQKQNLFLDEYLTFSRAQSVTMPNPGRFDFPANDVWREGSWVDAGTARSFLSVEPHESVLLSEETFTSAARRVRSYYVLLNMLEATLCPGTMGLSVAMGFNIVVFAAGQAVLYLVARGIGSSRWASLLTVLTYGSSSMAITHVTYARFYVWVAFLFLLVVLLHEKMWSCDSVVLRIVMAVASLGLLYLALRNSELVVIYGGMLVLGYGIALAVSGKRARAVIYLAPILVVTLAYLWLKTPFIDMLLNPQGYVHEGWPKGTVVENLLTTTPATFFSFLGWCLWRLGWTLFGSPVTGLLMVVAIVAALIAARRGTPPSGSDDEADVTGWGEGHELLVVLALVVIVHLVFLSVTRLQITRYMMAVVPIASAVMWRLLDEPSRHLEVCRKAAAIGLVLALFGVVSPFMTRDVEYLYDGDAELIQNLADYADTDVVCVMRVDEYAGHMIYDCIGHAGDSARIYPMSTGDAHIEADTCPDELLVWTSAGFDPLPYLDDLIDAGYTPSPLGSTHESDVYVFTRQS